VTEVQLFLVRLTCCGRDAGFFGPVTWDEADRFREGYLSGVGVKDASDPHSTGHDRSAIIVAADDAQAGAGGETPK